MEENNIKRQSRTPTHTHIKQMLHLLLGARVCVFCAVQISEGPLQAIAFFFLAWPPSNETRLEYIFKSNIIKDKGTGKYFPLK